MDATVFETKRVTKYAWFCPEKVKHKHALIYIMEFIQITYHCSEDEKNLRDVVFHGFEHYSQAVLQIISHMPLDSCIIAWNVSTSVELFSLSFFVFWRKLVQIEWNVLRNWIVIYLKNGDITRELNSGELFHETVLYRDACTGWKLIQTEANLIDYGSLDQKHVSEH